MNGDYQLEAAALEDLLDAIYREYHYDFRDYSRVSLHRGVARARSSLGVRTTEALAGRLRHEPELFSRIIPYLTIQVSDFFRDPAYYAAFRERVVGHLATYPSVRIWVAGCGAGEEAYSLAIILHEEGLLDRSLIYATDIAASALAVARAGVYDIRRVQGFSRNYFEAGGRGSLSDHYAAGKTGAVFSSRLRDRILFSDHSLATDAAFAEVQMVSCRNVLIYFDSQLRERAIGLFRDSICPRGFLGLGAMETLTYSPHANAFEAFAPGERIYRLKGKR